MNTIDDGKIIKFFKNRRKNRCKQRIDRKTRRNRRRISEQN